jgi:5-methylcytosine-specific restriction endonuclease McrA
MTGLSRCGRVYPTFDAAYKAAASRMSKGSGDMRVMSCAFGEHWHVTATKVIGRRERYRPDPFPPVVQKLIDARDGGLCQRCGSDGRMERHHRRAKGSGGSRARSHTQCPCNALSLCWRCHRWAHEHPARARDLGIVVPQHVDRPGRVSVERYKSDREFAADEQWLTCSGQWVHCPAETEE